MNPAYDLEKRSSAVTLSDMEVFVFPELIYSLTLANIMSPRLWRWRDDPWFAGVSSMTPQRRITRVKQYVMDHYAFNLDLDTWGLTTKQQELARFSPFIDTDAISRANALFGYEGDHYYFDLDIRTHFGLDKYAGDIIPYWKTETVEAMDAFRHRPNYGNGAGECVSLAALYASALFVVGRIPLHSIYMMATPLHSQNFVDVHDGILTNNRRLVTKAMWFNGTALSAQARRALENECVTIVAHETGFIHTVYREATIDPKAFEHVAHKLRAFLKTNLTSEILGNFLRHCRDIQPCFQFRWPIAGIDHYIPAERVFEYEQGCSFLVTDRTRPKLFTEIEREDFRPAPLPGRIVFNEVEEFVAAHRIDLDRPEDVRRLADSVSCECMDAERVMRDLIRFCYTEPRLPDPSGKAFAPAAEPLGLTLEMDRAAVIARLESVRPQNAVADMAFYAYRDLTRTEPEPFTRAALRRNPVSIEGAKALDDAALIAAVGQMPGESIYDEAGRLAQPDEVWNFGRGDGVEKALLLANVLLRRRPGTSGELRIGPAEVVLTIGSESHTLPTSKGLPPQTWPLRTT